MTIAVVIKVNDGLVFASDSASTLGVFDEGRVAITNIYNNANKIFNLHKDLPIGAMTWGLGNIGPASISSLAKDLRRRLTAPGVPGHADWVIDPISYTVRGVAERAREFLWEERYRQLLPAGAGEASALGFMVGGYSAGEELAEAYMLQMNSDEGCSDPIIVHPQEECGASWWGQPEAVTRLINGVSGDMPAALVNLGVGESDAPAYTRALIDQVRQNFVSDGMPIQDAIDLAEFLVDTTIKFVRFAPQPATVGGPIEVAAVTKHEGFKWIARKHYYTSELNPSRGAS